MVGLLLVLVGAQLLVEPVALLRRQQKFPNLDALCGQIAADAVQAEALLASACGVGVGEAPADEGHDAAQQQNP